MKTKNTILLSLGNKFDMFQNHRNQDFQSLKSDGFFPIINDQFNFIFMSMN